MSGFAVMIAPGSAPQAAAADFQHFLGLTAQYKQLKLPAAQAAGSDFLAAKFDSPATRHPGICHEPQTGSWLLAAGTVVALTGDARRTNLLQDLLQDYLEHGEKALEAYDGHFALVIYNGREASLSVLTDPMGLFGVFFGRRGSQVFISNSAFAVANQTHAQPDVLSAEHFLRTGRLDGDRTLWRDVKRLMPGRVMKVSQGKVEEHEYWTPTVDPAISRLSMADALDQSAGILSQTFSRLLANEGKTWVDLTGGFDSRLVALFVEKSNHPFITYCMGPADAEDVQLSQKISAAMQWEYVHSQLPEKWEPNALDTFSAALGNGDGRASLLRFAVTLRGFSTRNAFLKTNTMGVGGENLRGYDWQIEKGNIGKTNQLNMKALLNNLFYTPIPIQVMRSDRSAEVRQELAEYIQRLCSPYAQYPNTVQLDRFGMGRDSGHGGAYLSAAASIERSLAPLCFKAMVNFAFSLNYQWKLPRYHLFVRALMERQNQRLASLPTTTGGPAFPIRITNIHKFWPLWKGMTNRAAAIGSKKLLGKAVQLWPQPHSTGYPLPAWRDTFHTYARSEGMLSYDKLSSAGLYRRNEFDAWVEQDRLVPQPPTEFVDRVISIEMAMRAVGSRID